MPIILKLAGTGLPEEYIRRTLGAGVDEALVDRLVQDFTPESRSYFTYKVHTEIVAPVCGYITITGALPMPQQNRYAARLQPAFLRNLTGGQLPMLRYPKQLAGTISDFQKVVNEQD
ncbi:MAG: hypothetical protein ACRCSP_10070 [Rhodoglobus sp.]